MVDSVDLAATANVSMVTDNSTEQGLNLTKPQYPLYPFLLAYRWGSLLVAMWLFLFTTDVVTPEVSLAALLAISIGSTVLITILYIPRGLVLLNNPLFLVIDLLFVVTLLTFSGVTRSPFNLYALSPVLAGALFFQMRGALLSAGAFTMLYPMMALLAQRTQPITIDVGQLFTQLVGAWLVTILFGSLSNLYSQLQQAHQSLAATHADLARQNAELATTYQQLEIIHDLTLFLHASDKLSIQQRLLKVVTQELNFPRAIIGLVNPALRRLEGWVSYPSTTKQPSTAPPLSLREENGPIIEVVLNQQIAWCSDTQELTIDKTLNVWLGSNNWLIIPMVWQEQTVGVFLVAVESMGPVDFSDDRWAILTSLVSQAAVALGTVDRTHRLAVEEERNRIARDIHDTVAQSLFGIAFTLDACIKLLPQQVEAVKAELGELQELADRVRREVRQSILDLWPSELTQEQFQMDLRKYVVQCAPTHMFNVDFKIDGDFDGLSPLIRRNLYRVCQEALTNAAQHASTDHARVYLCIEPEEVYLSVRDKGQGFDLKPALAREKDREKFGIRGMQERIQSLGGSCNILSEVGYGTQVLVRVPANGKNGHHG